MPRPVMERVAGYGCSYALSSLSDSSIVAVVRVLSSFHLAKLASNTPIQWGAGHFGHKTLRHHEIGAEV